MAYQDKRIKKVLIQNKGYGMIAKCPINAGDIVIKETPSITINDNKIYSEVFQLLYIILSNPELTTKFQTLYPNTIEHIKISKANIQTELKKVIANDNNIYEFFVNKFTLDEIMILCAKYMCNAFQFQDKPVILFTGTILNHSCLPNVIFGEKNNQMCFMAIRDIQKGEEICDSYIDITMSTKQRKKELKEQYGFDCQCERCIETDVGKIKKMNKQAIDIEIERKKEFGFSKSKYV